MKGPIVQQQEVNLSTYDFVRFNFGHKMHNFLLSGIVSWLYRVRPNNVYVQCRE